MTLNAQVLEGAWNQIKGKIHDRWGELTDDDLQRARGNVEQLVGLIQRKTGETRATVSDYLEELTSEAAEAADTTTEAVMEYLSSAAESVRETAEDALESMRAGYEQTEGLIRRRPMESLAVCFGAGLIAGVIVSLVVRNK